MKILVYDWCLHVIGGGQKVNCRIAEHLSKKHDVDILTLFPIKKQELEKIYSVDFSKIGKIIFLYPERRANDSLLFTLCFRKVSKIARVYDLFINADAHETVNPQAKYNIMYCHFFKPLKYRPSQGLLDFLKMKALYIFRKILKNYSKQYDSIYCNSEFTKNWLKKLWKVDAKVIYPFVEIPKKIARRKENIILSTGRLNPDKNYEFVINCFKKIYDSGIKDYRCIIVGAVNKESLAYYEKLEEMIRGYPITIITNLDNEKIGAFYSKSKIFLMAKGIDVDENKYPTLLENFGMAPVEAMAHGCVPVVLNKGGYKETVENGKSGFLFNNESEAIEKLKLLIQNEKLRERMSKNARKRAKKFSLERMQREIDKAIKETISKN